MRLLMFSLLASLCISSIFAQNHGSNYSATMGPVAFLWPPDREWGAAVDNIGPCGSSAGVANRTRFPNERGNVALVIQDESWQVNIAISYFQNPTKQSDFKTIVDASSITEIDEGHMCFPVPAPNDTDNVQPGTNATLQIMYTSDFEEHVNQTFYACADITYVLVDVFTDRVPCFNATVPGYKVNGTSAGSAGSTSSAAPVASSSSAPSGGAIAGVVIGVLLIVGGCLGGVFFLYRRREQLKRNVEHEISPRSVRWESHSPSTLVGSPTPSGKGNDIVLDEIRKT